jgi:hypothetical protein
MELPVLGQIAQCSFVLPPIAGFIYRAHLGKPERLFFYYVLVAALFIGIQEVLGRWHWNNHGVSNMSRLLEISMVEAAYFIHAKRHTARWIFVFFEIVFVSIWGSDQVYHFIDNAPFNSFMAVVARTTLAISSTVSLYVLFRTSRTVLDTTMFWAASGVLVYNMSTVVVLGVSNEVLRMAPEHFDTLWYINWTMGIVANLFFVKGFSCTLRIHNS